MVCPLTKTYTFKRSHSVRPYFSDMHSILLALTSGILLGFAFPPYPFGLLSFVAFVPLMVLWIDRVPQFRKRHIVGLTYVTFFVFHGLTNWWVGSWQEHTDPYLMASGIALWLGHPFFLALPWYVLAYIRRRLGAGPMLWSSPFIVCAFEWLHGQTDASYPWLTTGMMTVNTPFAQAADIVGVYGLTFAVVLINALVVATYLAYRNAQRTTAIRLAIACLAVLLPWCIYGVVASSRTYGYDYDQDVKVHLVQPNIDPWDKWSDPRVQVAAHIRLEDSILATGNRPDIVVWSETAIPFAIRGSNNAPEFAALRTWVDTSRIALLTGYSDVMVYAPSAAPPSARRSKIDSTQRFDSFNAAMVLQSGQAVIPVHRKSMLTPFAERLPFADDLTFAMDWFQWGVGISSWGKGPTREPLPVVVGAKTLRVGTIICIESIYPQVARDMVRNGADVLCVITNDAWYNGTIGPRQHFDIARMRAIEQRRWIMRCANSGVTGFISPNGNNNSGTAVVTAPEQVATVCSGTVKSVKHRTLYNRAGDVVPYASAFATICIAVFSVIKRKQRVL